MKPMILVEVELIRKGAVNASREWQALIKRLKPYWPKWIPRDVYDLFYILPEDSELLEELKSLAAQYAKYVSLNPQYIWLEYTEEEAERFVGFIPYFFRSHFCQEYDDVDSEFEECDVCYAQTAFKESILWNGKSYGKNRLIMPDSYIKKHRNDNFVMQIDADAVDLISVALYENLMKLGENPSFFKSVRSKRGETLAYEFYTDVKLPKGALYCDSYVKTKECSKCGITTYLRDNRLKYSPFFIKEEYVDMLQTVAVTTDCYFREPITIISSKLRREINQLCPDAMFLPVEIETK